MQNYEDGVTEEISTRIHGGDKDSSLAKRYAQKHTEVADQIERAEFVLEQLTGLRREPPVSFSERLKEKWQEELRRDKV